MTWAPHPNARRLTPLEEAIATARVLRMQHARGSGPLVPSVRLTPSQLAYLNARYQAAHEEFARKHPEEFAKRHPMGDPTPGSDTAILAVSAVAIALYVGTTVASYYLVRDMAPKKSAKSYGAGAAAANLLFPIIGPVVVGLAAAGAQGKR